MQANLEQIMRDMTNGLNQFHSLQSKAMTLINKHLPELKDKPEFSEITAEIDKQQQRINELKDELRKCQ